jgi:endonuclease III related protein
MKSARTVSPEAMVRDMYRKLARSWGQQHWWPAETPFEVVVGAILTQNTSWTNVERALASLRAAGVLSVPGIREVPLVRLQELVHSSGYYRQKAQRLKDFVSFLDEKHAGSLETMFATPTDQLRAELLSLKGIGPETADAILLYAGNHEIFVVDAYTRRVLERHRAVDGRAGYDQVRTLVQRALQGERPPAVVKSTLPKKMPVHEPSAMSAARRSPVSQVYNEMHGLFVQVGKHYCLKQGPRCEACPLRTLLPAGPLPL